MILQNRGKVKSFLVISGQCHTSPILKFWSTFFKRWRFLKAEPYVDLRRGRNTLRASNGRRPADRFEGVKPPLVGGFRSFTLRAPQSAHDMPSARYVYTRYGTCLRQAAPLPRRLNTAVFQRKNVRAARLAPTRYVPLCGTQRKKSAAADFHIFIIFCLGLRSG